jgi:arginyl-tRNA synthetase
VVDAGQADHLNMVFDVSRLANWTVDPKSGVANVKAASASGARPMRLDHMKFGVVLGEDGKKFKTRSGATVKLSDLLDEAAERFLADFKARLDKDGAKTEVPEEEFDKVSKQIGYAAVKYADLHQNRETDYKFSYDKMLQSTGDTAVYLLYTHARIASILKKAKDEKGVDTSKVGSFLVSLDAKEEVMLATEIMKLPEALEMAIDELKPSHMTKYLYDTCQSFSNFYTNCKVLHSDVPPAVRDSRLVLVAACGAALRKGFAVLGIDPLYRI